MKAQDRGNPSLSSFSTVSIVIIDVNDYAPQFESSRYDLWISENSPIGTTVGTIIARDQDEGDNALIQFRIFGGIDAKLFDIETARAYLIFMSRLYYMLQILIYIVYCQKIMWLSQEKWQN